MARKPKAPLQVETLTHDEASRRNIPTAELQSVMHADDLEPRQIRYARNHDLDPQLMWRGKDEQDWSDLVVNAPPLFIQEKVHPKVLIDDLVRRTKERKDEAADDTPDLFADFNGIAPDAVTEFYEHEQNWTNRMILGDSLQVMASLAEREGLRGKVQCIYFDPPYGIKFNSNFQWSTTTRDVKDGKADHITREPEQVRAFRDTWKDGIHSYLTYLRDRLTVARDLLTESGSIFVQIGDENLHAVKSLMNEVFGDGNFLSLVTLQKTGGQETSFLPNVTDYIVWFAKDKPKAKYRQPYLLKEYGVGEGSGKRYDRIRICPGMGRTLRKEEKNDESLIPDHNGFYQLTSLISSGVRSNTTGNFEFQKNNFHSGETSNWKTSIDGLKRLSKSDRIEKRKNTIAYVRYINDFPAFPLSNIWADVAGAANIVYVVQTSTTIIQRCILMATDAGDLVLDPTCGSGTTAAVAEQWGRRWITIDTSRVALALARARIMGAKYPYYLLADSREGQQQEAEITRKPPVDRPTRGDVRHGFVYERVPHITLKSIANNAEIDVIWEQYQEKLEPLRASLNAALDQAWEEWEIPREADAAWPKPASDAHAAWWKARIARQKEIDASIAGKADQEFLYDRPYEDKARVRVAGPFTVESLSPHRVVPIDEDDELMEIAGAGHGSASVQGRGGSTSGSVGDFARIVIENLKAAGVHQQKKDDRITFTSVTGWPGEMIAAEGRYMEESESTAFERRAAIFIGPEFGTVARPDLIAAAREAADAGFDILIACAFNYDAHSAEVEKLGRINILKARMNPDLHMAGDLKAERGNLFVVFGEPDIDILKEPDGRLRVKIHGVDVFRPSTGEIDSGGVEDIAMWFIDTAYNEESFFVRHAYFLGANSDPYKSLKTTLKAEIDEEAWDQLRSDTSRPFDRPTTGRIAVKVINHLGDEVMKVFAVPHE